MPAHDHDHHDHDHTVGSSDYVPGYFEIMEIAIGELLVENGGGRFHQYLRLSQRRLPQSVQNQGESAAPPPFIVRFVAGRQALQMRDQFLPAGYAVSSNLAGDTRPQDLLGSSRTYLQERLERLTIYPRPGEAAKLCDDFVQPPIPCGFIGHCIKLT